MADGPLDVAQLGTVNVASNAGWTLGGWGTATPDNVSNYGPHNYGVGNKGSQNFGSSNTGTRNFGSSNVGSGNFGSFNFGSNNCGSYNVGSGNVGSSNVGSFNAGSSNVGLCNTGTGATGLLNSGNYTVGFANAAAGSSVLGYNNTGVGTDVIGLGNTGAATSQTFNSTASFLIGNMMTGVTGSNNIGYLTAGNAPSASNTIGYGNSGGSGNIGFFNVGSGNVGSFNYGSGNTGNLNGVQSFSLAAGKSGPSSQLYQDYIDLSEGVMTESSVSESSVSESSVSGSYQSVVSESSQSVVLESSHSVVLETYHSVVPESYHSVVPESSNLSTSSNVSTSESEYSATSDTALLKTHFHTGPSPLSTTFTIYNFADVEIVAVNTTLLSHGSIGWSNVNASNYGAGNSGWLETGFGNIGYNNTGQNNSGYLNIGIGNTGSYNINNGGTNNTGSASTNTPVTFSSGTFPALLTYALDGYQDAQASSYPALFDRYAQPMLGALGTYAGTLSAPCTRANATCATLPMADVTSNVFSVSLGCPGSVKVTDLYCSGDSYAIYKDGLPWLSTPIVPPDADPTCLNPVNDPEEAFYSERFAHAIGYLPSGRYTIWVRATVSPYGGGGIAIKVDEFCAAPGS